MSTFYVVYHSSASFTGAGAAHEQMLDQYAAACDAAELGSPAVQVRGLPYWRQINDAGIRREIARTAATDWA